MEFLRPVYESTASFEMFGSEHLISVIIAFLLGIFLIYYSRNKSIGSQTKYLKVLSLYISGTVVIWAIFEIYLGRFEIDKDLPLVFCNFIALLLPLYIFTFKRSTILFNIIYYVIIGGAIQAIITPGLKMSFPHYEYIKFWSVHAGLIIFVLYEIIILKRRPNFSGVLWAFLFVQAHVIFSFLLNLILDSNYLFLNAKPNNASILDLLGGWPYYIIWMQIILIPYFSIFYLPFFKRKK